MGATKLKSIRPDIFSYHDYREFLNDHIQYLKSEVPGFSVRSLAKEVGVSASYFTMVLREGAPLSPRVLAKLGEPLKLNREELNYCAHLASLIDAKNLEDQLSVFKKLSRTGLFKNRQHEALLAHQYFSNWYYVAIRELANQQDFKADPDWISDQLTKRVPLTDIRSALDFLLTYGLIVKSPNGQYRASERHIKCEGPIFRLALGEFYKQTYEMCIEAIYSTPREQRYLASHSLAISEEGFTKLQEILNDTMLKLQELTLLEEKNSKNKRVYHISMASIPMSKLGRSSS